MLAFSCPASLYFLINYWVYTSATNTEFSCSIGISLIIADPNHDSIQHACREYLFIRLFVSMLGGGYFQNCHHFFPLLGCLLVTTSSRP